jgi:(1->4)-alpha-D-glucan 1-alpha-D-glucosylmutase
MNERSSDVSVTAAPDVDAILDTVANQLAGRRLPQATYRVQFNRSFTFRDAAELVPYLAELGISDCYASPFVKASAGSAHGYDIVDHSVLNPEIGNDADFDRFTAELQRRGMGHILDVVPNHMGVASGENSWWLDVLENGPGSPYAAFFDIDWMPLKPDLANKVLLPILGDQFGKVLEDQQLVLSFEDGAFCVRYFDRRFPLGPHSWPVVLKHRLDELERQLGADHAHVQEYQSILTAIGHLPPLTETDPEKVNERRREKEVVKRRLSELCRASAEVNDFVAANVRIFNGTRGDPRSFDLLDQLLLDQAYRLAYWRVAADEINYRRFFDINELAAICMENPGVFDKTHALIFQLVASGKVDGLRIDHPDGLYDPAEYLWRLQRTRFLQMCRHAFDAARQETPAPVDGNGHRNGERGDEPTNGHAVWPTIERELTDRYEAQRSSDPNAPLAQPLYVVVEKILERGERLPENWPIHGTTGYEFLNELNGLFVDRANAKTFDAIYSRFIRQRLDFKELVYQCKKIIMQASMSSEIGVLGHQLDRISEQNRWSRDFTLSSQTEAIREIIANFPVYRTYIGESGVLDRDRRYVEMAVSRAKRRNPATSASIFDFVRNILLLKYPDNATEAAQAAQRRFVGKFQQVTGPVMAKAVEDTAFYIYNRLVSLNEVGGDPEKFGTTVAAFHQQNLDRRAHWPHTLLTTSTHDTKRSEDVRARINVLSEIPQEWRSHLARWGRVNQRKKVQIEGELAPSRNDEYLLYQTLVGTWPFDAPSRVAAEQYIERIQQYMLKATREAKVNTSWVSPNEPYERALREFIAAILTESHRNPFLADFVPFARRIGDCGIWNSLSQTLLKLTSPGVADVYQGTELWNLSLVDPDNRSPVDYAARRRALTLLNDQLARAGNGLDGFARELVSTRTDGRIKLFVIARSLRSHREHPVLFSDGAYVPLEATGSKKENLCAYARRTGGISGLVVVPRFVMSLTSTACGPPLGEAIWGDTWLPIRDDPPGSEYRNIFTGEILNTTEGETGAGLPVAQILRNFPVALLEATR